MMLHDPAEFRDHYPQPEKWRWGALRAITLLAIAVVVAWAGAELI